jgi:Ala-tRNA(Pro) deacylase
MAEAHLLAVLDAAGIAYEVLEHERTERAAAEAEALSVDPGEVAKTLVVTTPVGNIRAVLPASKRIDLGKVATLVETRKKRLHLATEDDLGRDYGDFELGAVPPFGGQHRDRVVVDSGLAERDSVVLEAGSHVRSIRLKTADLVRVTEAQVADISQD